MDSRGHRPPLQIKVFTETPLGGQTGVFRRSAAFQDSPSEMLRTSTRRPPAGLPQPRRRPACRMTPGGREAGPSVRAGRPQGEKHEVYATGFRPQRCAETSSLLANAAVWATAVCGCGPAGYARLGRRCGTAGERRKPPGAGDNGGKQGARVGQAAEKPLKARHSDPALREKNRGSL